MDAISNNAVNLGSLLSNIKAPSETASTSDAKAVSKVAIVALPKTNVKESSQEMREAAETAMKDIQHFISSQARSCLLYTSPSPRDRTRSRMPSSA